MRWSGLAGLSVERLRWILLAGGLLLVGVLVALLSYGHYRAVKAWKQILARSGATITHETDGFTYSQAVGGKPIFKVNAKHAVPHGDGRYTLEDGTLVLYGANGQPAYRISGAQFDYDQKSEVAKALGEVDMELELPKALAAGPRAKLSQGTGGSGPAGEASGEQVIHVRTSGLTYVKKLGVAATDQEVEIEYGRMHGWAKGAEFDTAQSVVHLLADVGAEAELHGDPVTLNAAKADLDRDSDLIALWAPRLDSRGRTATAASAILHLRKDGSLDTVDARGGVTLRQGTRTIWAPTLHAAMNEDSQMEHAALLGGVALADTSAVRPMNGSAKTARVAFDEEGHATNAVLDGSVAMSMEDHRGGTGVARQMKAERVTLTMRRVAHRGDRISAIEAQGGWVRADALVKAGKKTTSIAGDELKMTLAQDAAGKDEPQTLTGTGHTGIEQQMPDGTIQRSTGDALEARFMPQGGRGLEIASAEQTGDVRITTDKPGEVPGKAMAERVALDGASDVLTLTSPQPASEQSSKEVCRGPRCSSFGYPRLMRGDTSVSAETIRITQQTGDAVAEGDVTATVLNANAKPGTLPTHVLAQRGTLRKAQQTVEFTGTDASPARMWQGASQVEAANLLLDRGKDSMQAWPASPNGVVRAVFAGGSGKLGSGLEGQAAKGQRARGPGGQRAGGLELKGDRVVSVTSARLVYSGASHEAVFTGGVVAQGEDGQVRAQRGVAFLSQGQGLGIKGSEGQGHGARPPGSGELAAAKEEPNPVAASLEKIVLSGGVKVRQAGRVGTGEQLLYTAATGEFVLTGTPGHPPHIVDDKQGSITGATLLFRSADSTIVVAGGPASRRVHTETTIRK